MKLLDKKIVIETKEKYLMNEVYFPWSSATSYYLTPENDKKILATLLSKYSKEYSAIKLDFINEGKTK